MPRGAFGRALMGEGLALGREAGAAGGGAAVRACRRRGGEHPARVAERRIDVEVGRAERPGLEDLAAARALRGEALGRAWPCRGRYSGAPSAEQRAQLAVHGGPQPLGVVLARAQHAQAQAVERGDHEADVELGRERRRGARARARRAPAGSRPHSRCTARASGVPSSSICRRYSATATSRSPVTCSSSQSASSSAHAAASKSVAAEPVGDRRRCASPRAARSSAARPRGCPPWSRSATSSRTATRRPRRRRGDG